MNARWPIEVLAVGPVRGAATSWRARGNLGLTIVAKSTFSIAGVDASLLADPDAIVIDDEHAEGSAFRGVERASDLAPYKPLADVTMIGHACALRGAPVAAMSVRLGVFRSSSALLDKTINVVGNTPTEGASPLAFERMPLSYERAARSVDNPIGAGAHANLRDPRAPLALAGFAPISRFWRARRDLLAAEHAAEIDAPIPTLEASFPWDFFQDAPSDQRVGYLRGDEWIVIDGVNPTRPRIASRLPGVRAAARVTLLQGGARKQTVLRLLLDTLAIDADRLIANVAWRARIELPEGVRPEDVSIAIGLEMPDASIAWPTGSVPSTRVPTPVPSSGVIPAPKASPIPSAPPSPMPSPIPSAPPSPARRENPLAQTMELDFARHANAAPAPALPFRGASEPKRSYSPPPLTWKELTSPRPPSEPPAHAPSGPARKTPSIPIVHASPFSAATVAWQLRPPQTSLTVIVKGTFDLVHGGPARARAESDLVTGDLHADGDHAKSLAYASDFAIVKPRVDVTCVGRAYAPGGSGVATRVELAIGSIRRSIAVFGDRRWDTTLGVRAAQSSPAPFTSMPLVYERAFGGPSSEANPVGLGRDGALLPNLEDPDRLIRSPSDAPAPACFAPIAITWPERANKLGTYGGSYRAKRWPYFAEDFDPSYFQAAPASQRLERANGDESFRIVGMHPELVAIEGSLPGVRARCFVEWTRAKGGRFEEIPLRLDTIAFDMNEGKVNLVWRGLVDVSEDEAPEINALFVVGENLERPATHDEMRALYLARVTPPKVVEAEPRAELPANDTSTSVAPPAITEVPLPPDETVPFLAAASPDAIAKAMRDAGASDEEIEKVLNPTPPIEEAPPMKPARELGVRGEVIAAIAARASLAGRDLSGSDLSKLDLSGLSLAGAKLSRADLSGVIAIGADFSGATADRARFTGANLAGARFDGATLTGADLSRAILEDASLVKCSAADVRLYDAKAARAKLDESDLTGARAAGVELDGATLRGIVAERSIWENASIENATFAAAKLAGSSFSRVRGAGVSFAAADVKEGRFRRASLEDAIFLRANLMAATFERACLDRADLRGANLHGAETWNASLDGAQLELAIVTRSKLAEGAR